FTRSVRVSERPQSFADIGALAVSGPDATGTAKGLKLSFTVNQAEFRGGDTDELMVDANGVFHAVWIDNRTGLSQIWTAPITVPGAAIKNGAAELAALEDVSSNVQAKLKQPRFDRETNLLTASVRLKNVSKDTIRGPLKVRVVGVESQLGTPTILNADDGL